MNITWFNEKPKDGVATLYDSNITLNITSIEKLKDCYSVMLGIDYDKKLIFIKPLTKEMDLRGDIPEEQKYKITIRSSYGRISNKDFMKEIAKLGYLNYENGPFKFSTSWNEKEKFLVIDLGKREGE